MMLIFLKEFYTSSVAALFSIIYFYINNDNDYCYYNYSYKKTTVT